MLMQEYRIADQFGDSATIFGRTAKSTADFNGNRTMTPI